MLHGYRKAFTVALLSASLAAATAAPLPSDSGGLAGLPPAAVLGAENALLARRVAEAEGRARRLEDDLRETRAAVAAVEAGAARLRTVEQLWLTARAALVALTLALAVLAAIAAAALRQCRRAQRHAHVLGQELEDKRRALLAERQEGARRILDLELRLREAEAQRAPRVVIGGRGR